VHYRHAVRHRSGRWANLAALAEVDLVIVAPRRLAGRTCFFCGRDSVAHCALLTFPLSPSVGHHTDRHALDDVAAVSCSTPTHAAEAAARSTATSSCREAQAASLCTLTPAGRFSPRQTFRVPPCACATTAPASDSRPTSGDLSRRPGAPRRERARLHHPARDPRRLRAGVWIASERHERRALVVWRNAASALHGTVASASLASCSDWRSRSHAHDRSSLSSSVRVVESPYGPATDHRSGSVATRAICAFALRRTEPSRRVASRSVSGRTR